MKTLVLAVVLLLQTDTVVCRVGSWSGSLEDLAAIQAVHERTEAQQAGQPYPTGAPDRSLFSQYVKCERSS